MCPPEFHLVGARMRTPNATRLRSVHLSGDARRTHVRRSRHYLFTTRRSRAGKWEHETPLGRWRVKNR
ncbi:hypothetical protein CRG98_001126 [Punica granatum]|uniref:Uncharacterized protein n=1 Tax=Punica granatum TaxID=22663 RepID=A0A2I0LE38_PUNGR|nr:hypothetical protein CRG98_001126 [Punica granatum]